MSRNYSDYLKNKNRGLHSKTPMTFLKYQPFPYNFLSFLMCFNLRAKETSILLNHYKLPQQALSRLSFLFY